MQQRQPYRPFAGVGWQPVEPPGGGGEPPPVLDGDTVALLTEIRDLLIDVRQELREQVQEGIVYTITQQVVSTIVPTEVSFGTPLFSVTLINDGGGTVQFRVPNRTNATWVNLAPTEVVTFNFVKAKITSVAFLAIGAAASVRVIGTY